MLVSGIAQLAASWVLVAEALAARGQSCVLLPENPGIGRSHAVPVPRTCAGHAELILRTLEAANLNGQVHVVGLSLGSMIAAELAAQLGPRAASLCMVAGSCSEGGFWRLSPAALARMAGRALLGRSGLRGRLPELVSGAVLAQHPEILDELLQLLRIEGGYARGALLKQVLAGRRFALRPLLANLPQHKLVIVGDADRLVATRHSDILAGLLAAPLQHIAGRGHYLPVDAPNELAALLDAHFRSAPLT